MNRDYVTAECAKLLQKKGYPLRRVYKYDGGVPILFELPKEHPDWCNCDAWYIPTLWEVQLWLDEQHHNLIGVGYGPSSMYRYVIMYTDERCTTEPTESCRGFKSMPDALQAGIMNVLTRIK